MQPPLTRAAIGPVAGSATPSGTPGGDLPLGPASAGDGRVLGESEIKEALGQTIRDALDLGGWERGGGLENLLTRVRDAITASVQQEKEIRRQVRRLILGRLRDLPEAPALAGVYRASERQLREARRNILLRGGATAVEGACTAHDGLAATIISLAVSLVCYDGALHSWRTTFLRRDYDVREGDTIERLRQLLDRRARRGEGGQEPLEVRDRITYLLRRAVMAAAERKALLDQADSRWRIGHGVPAPLELLTGSGSMELIDEALPMLEALLLGGTRWVFVPSALEHRALDTLAQALDPGELAVFAKGKSTLDVMVEAGTYDLGYRRRVQEFAARAGEAFVVGGFRATPFAPARLFFAHSEHALQAGLIAMADAALQPHSGYPLLLEIARRTAEFGLGVAAFRGAVESAYARAGGTGLFTPERVVGSV